MTALLELLATNALLAVPLAALAWAAERWLRRPGVAHGLWALALLKLLTPPLLPLPVIPASPAAIGPGVAAVARGEHAVPTDAALDGRTPPRRASGGLQVLAAAAVALGGLGVLALALARGRRFLRLVADAEPAPADARARLEQLARRLNVPDPPAFQVVAAPVPPLIWAGARGARLLVSSALLRDLTPAETDALLAHELAHLRRRDHWMRAVELAAAALFWWYPLTWWVRRRMRAAEELCCDEWVLRALPGAARDYARALVKSASLLSVPTTLPAGASGAVAARDLEKRVRGVLMTRPSRTLARPWRFALSALGVAALAALPTRGQDTQSTASPEAAAERATRTQDQDLARQQAELEQQRQELEANRRELEAARAEIEKGHAALEQQRRELEAHAREMEQNVREAIEARAAREAREADAAVAASRASADAERAREAAAAKVARKIEKARLAESAKAAQKARLADARIKAEAERAAKRARADALHASDESRAAAQAARQMAREMRKLAAELAVQLSSLREQDLLGPEQIERIQAEVSRLREALEDLGQR